MQKNQKNKYRRSRNDDGSDDGSDSSSTISQGKDSNKKHYNAEKLDKVEYAKLLAELFPSKYSVGKAKTLQSQSKSRKMKQVVASSSSCQEEEEKEKEKEQQHHVRRSARLQKRATTSNQKKELLPEVEVCDELRIVAKKTNNADATGNKNKDKVFYQSKKPKYNEDDGAAEGEPPVLDKNGNYNIIINIQEPQFDYLSDQRDDDYGSYEDSAMNDSVFDDESISSDQEDSTIDSDDSYRESDDNSEESCDSDGDYDEQVNDEEEEEVVVTRGAAEAKKAENINFTINGKSIFKDDEKKDKVNYKIRDDDKKHGAARNDHDDDDELGSEDEATIQTIKKQMQAILELDKNNKIAKKTLAQMIEKEEKIKSFRKKKTVKQTRSNTRKFGRLLRKKNSANDVKYFKKYLTQEEQLEVLKELAELNKVMLVDKPYRLTLLESKIPQQYKAIALKRIQNLRYMDTCSGEYFKVKNWVDTFMTIPFGFYRTLPITMDAGVEQCHTFMEAAKDILDSAVYGLNDAKMQIMQMAGQWISNPSALGSAIAIKGPPGTGKTTLVKEGISKILGRDFAFIALGGATDSSFLEGHSYTYEGSTWGKIVEILIRCKSMNPVIFFDELDKLSETPKGEEITGILTHLTDTSQNSQFHDKYFSEIAFDLSKCLFIFSYNDESKVNPILLDRMYRIHTNGYGKKDKTHIAQKYLIPKIQSEVAFKPEQIIIPDETIEYIVEHHTNKEDGVRNLKRCLEIIFTKLNLYRLMKPGSKLFDKDSSSIEVVFPFTVTSSVVDIMIKKAETNSPPMFMYT